MSALNQKVALYCQGTFDYATPTQSEIDSMTTAAAEISQSGFGTVLLGQWHVHADGSVYYNNTPYTTDGFAWVMGNIPGLLKANGNVQSVLLTFGPFGSDFDAITANLPSFQAFLQGIFDSYDINGIDFDIEGSFNEANLNTLVTLTNWAAGQGKAVTAAPYNTEYWWQQLYAGTSNFTWWNLQIYGGADYGTWAASFPQAFLTYGCNAQYTSPSDVTAALQSTQQSYPGLQGGFIWRYEDIVGSAAAYAQAIFAGLQGS